MVIGIHDLEDAEAIEYLRTMYGEPGHHSPNDAPVSSARTVKPVTASPTTRANGPCPCGSGRKHKKCCK